VRPTGPVARRRVWQTASRVGAVMEEGLAFIKLQRIEDGSYVWSQWHQGQKESDIQGIQALE
jgi:hypothetical protein